MCNAIQLHLLGAGVDLKLTDVRVGHSEQIAIEVFSIPHLMNVQDVCNQGKNVGIEKHFELCAFCSLFL